MDFKLTRSQNGITALQLDVKIKGLKMEIEDLARDRFGEDYEEALNNFIRGFAFKTEHHKWLSLNEAKVIKNRLLELNSEGSHG